MKKFTLQLNILIISCTLVALTGCSNEEFSDNEITEEVTLNTIGQKRNCGTCSTTVYPGALNQFKASLKKMDLEHHWNGGADQDNHANPQNSGACDVDFFTRCGNQMVLSSTGGVDDRTELKLPSAYNQSLNNYSQMRFTAQIVDIPSSSISSKQNKGVTIAQIHNRGTNVERPLARIDIAGYRKKVRATFAHGYKKTDGDTSIDLLDYDEGDSMYVRLRINSDGNAISLYVRNFTQNIIESGTWVIDDGSNWFNKTSTFYYKTGVYQQLAGEEPSISYNYLYFNSL